jgi:hypothetical protein
VTLAQTSAYPLTRRHTDNPRAYHLYLKGRFYWARRYQAGMQKALEYFQKAIEEDAGYALGLRGRRRRLYVDRSVFPDAAP